jgi:hypothetical protein
VVDSLVLRLTLQAMGAFAITYPSVAADLGFREPAVRAPTQIQKGTNHD